MQRYSFSLRSLHWLSAALIVFMVTTGMMYFLEIADKQALTAHQIAGQILIVVLTLRIISKLRSPSVVHAGHAAWERVLSKMVQAALYLMLIGFVVTGYVSASAYTNNALLFPVDLGFARSAQGETLLYTHYNLKWVLLGLMTLHIGGALKHYFIDRDDTFQSIWFANK